MLTPPPPSPPPPRARSRLPQNTRKTVLQYSSAGALIGLGVCGALTMRTNLSTLRRVILASSGGMLGALTGTAASTREWYPKLLALDDSSALARTARQAEERRRQKGAPEQTGIIGLGAAAAAGGTKDS